MIITLCRSITKVTAYDGMKCKINHFIWLISDVGVINLFDKNLCPFRVKNCKQTDVRSQVSISMQYIILLFAVYLCMCYLYLSWEIKPLKNRTILFIHFSTYSDNGHLLDSIHIGPNIFVLFLSVCLSVFVCDTLRVKVITNLAKPNYCHEK